MFQRFYFYHKQGGNDHDIAQSVDEETYSFICDGDYYSGKRWSDKTGSMKSGGVKGDCIADIIFSVNYLNNESMSCRCIESHDYALDQAKDYNGCNACNIKQNKCGKNKCLHHEKGLSDYQYLIPVISVSGYSGNWRKDK